MLTEKILVILCAFCTQCLIVKDHQTPLSYCKAGVTGVFIVLFLPKQRSRVLVRTVLKVGSELHRRVLVIRSMSMIHIS